MRVQQDGATALHLAAYNDHTNTVKVSRLHRIGQAMCTQAFIAASVDVNASDQVARQSVHLIIHRGWMLARLHSAACGC